jgi:hypothetical protein
METAESAGVGSGEVALSQCAECGTMLEPGIDRETTDSGTFCRNCYTQLVARVQQALDAQGQGINYGMALAGALAGGAIGVVAWWGFTVLTKIAFGLVAIVIGLAVGKGTVLLSGGKRSTGLQGMSLAVSIGAFFYASYLVNRTFVHQAFVEDGIDGKLPFLPTPAGFVEIIGLSFGGMDLLFLAIVAYQAWKIPAPMQVRASA